MTIYTAICFQKEVQDPALPMGGGLNVRERFAQPVYSITAEGGVVTVTHGASGVAVDVPFSLVREAIRAVEAPKTKKVSKS